jgi:hypothetical protein
MTGGVTDREVWIAVGAAIVAMLVTLGVVLALRGRRKPRIASPEEAAEAVEPSARWPASTRKARWWAPTAAVRWRSTAPGVSP